MKITLAVAILTLCGCGTTSGLHLDSAPIPASSDASSRHVGTAVLVGAYEMLEGGDICFVSDHPVIAAMPKSATICFTNEQYAVDSLGIGSAVKTINTVEICGITGRAKITVSGLWTGH